MGVKHRAKSPTAWAATIFNSRPMESARATSVMAKLYGAFADLKAGTRDSEMFDRLGSAFNVGLVRAEQIDPLLEAPLLCAVDAMNRCDEIYRRHQRYGFDGPGIQAVAIALETYEAILRASSPNQLEEALAEAHRRMLAALAGEAQPC